MPSVSESESPDIQSDTAAKVLLPDETVIKELRPAWSAYWLPLLIVVLNILGGLIVAGGAEGMARRNGVGLLFLFPPILFGVLVFGMVYVSRMQTRYIVTEKRVLKIKGLLSKKTHTMWLRDITAIKTQESGFQRLSGHGSVTVAKQPISGVHQLPLLSLGNGITFGAVPHLYTVAEVIQTGANRLGEENSTT